MKSIIFLLTSLINLCVISKSFAVKGLAIKLDVTDYAQNEIINGKICKKAGIQANKAHYHLTIGYVAADLPAEQMNQLGKKIIKKLTKRYNNQNLEFHVKKACQPFKNNIIALIPSNKKELKSINGEVNNIVRSYKEKLNSNTIPDSYTPHITLSRNGGDVQSLPKLNSAIEKLKEKNNGNLYFKLNNFSYSIKK